MAVGTNRLDLCNMSVEDTKLLNRLYENYKYEYVNMLDRMSKRRNVIYWWVTPLASKYWLLSDSLKNICIALLGIKRIRANHQISEVYCPSKEIAQVIQDYFINKHRKIKITVKKNKNIAVIEYFLNNVYRTIQQYRTIHKVIKKNGINVEIRNEDITLIDTYIKASDIKGMYYEEQYFKNILEFTDRKIYFMPQLLLNTRISLDMLIKKLLNKCKYQYVFKEQFLLIQDFYKLLPYPLFCILFCIPKKYIDKIDVTPIINRDLINGIASDNAIEGMLKYWAVKRMKKNGLNIRRLIGWYEGQPSSIGLFKGYRKMYPNGKSIGYIGYSINTKNINIANTRMQTFYKAAPQELTVMAECFKMIPKQFVPDTKVIMVPALRLKQPRQIISNKTALDKNIMIALAYGQDASASILRWIKVLEQYFIHHAITVLIKNHPCNAGMTLKQYGIPDLKCDYKFVNGEFSDVVDKSLLVVTTQSTSGYETALYGKPIIFLNFSGELNFDYMPKEWLGIRYDVIYSTEELERAIDKF